MHVVLPADRIVAADRAFTYLARECLAGRISERDVAAVSDHIVVATDYETAVYDYPLGRITG
jgi:hypothetical protein